VAQRGSRKWNVNQYWMKVNLWSLDNEIQNSPSGTMGAIELLCIPGALHCGTCASVGNGATILLYGVS
jgi:hypothetical protein